MSAIVPIPKFSVSIRPATMDDLSFIDVLQKKHTKQVGWFPTKTIEGKLKLGHVLVAEEAGERIGYLIGNDQYFKRDDVGIIYQINIAEGKRRGLVGAMLLKTPAPKRQKQKNDPKFVAAARELRDRWLERVNADPAMLESQGKYEVSRALPATEAAGIVTRIVPALAAPAAA